MFLKLPRIAEGLGEMRIPLPLLTSESSYIWQRTGSGSTGDERTQTLRGVGELFQEYVSNQLTMFRAFVRTPCK